MLFWGTRKYFGDFFLVTRARQILHKGIFDNQLYTQSQDFWQHPHFFSVFCFQLKTYLPWFLSVFKHLFGWFGFWHRGVDTLRKDNELKAPPPKSKKKNSEKIINSMQWQTIVASYTPYIFGHYSQKLTLKVTGVFFWWKHPRGAPFEGTPVWVPLNGTLYVARANLFYKRKYNNLQFS